MDKKENMENIDLTIDEIQKMMDRMEKSTLGSLADVEREGSLDNVPGREK